MTSCHGSSKCLNLRNCKPFMTLIDGLQKPLNPSIVAFLRSQQCGFDRDGYPKVCCRTMPKELRVMNYTTTRIPTENATTTTVIPNYTTTTTTTMSTTTTTKSENLQTTTSINSDLSETTTIISTTTTEENSKSKRITSDEFNRLFMDDLFEYDLFRRRRGLKSKKYTVDVEIR